MENARQHYLSALGIETYMPRWVLPLAPLSYPCETGLYLDENSVPSTVQVLEPLETAERISSESVSQVLADLFKEQTAHVALASAQSNRSEDDKPSLSFTDVAHAANEKAIAPFAFSIWRPVSGVLIIDIRDIGEPLPTELLLHNILRAYLAAPFNLDEDVLRWPLLERRRQRLTLNMARQELLTWLAVEHELKPISELWLMGDLTREIFLDEFSAASVFTHVITPTLSLSARVMPSLKSILLDSALKANLSHFLFKP